MGTHWIIRNAHQFESLKAHLASLDRPFAVKILPVIHPKTAKQTRYAHSLCNSLAEARAEPPEVAKRDAKVAFGVVTLSTSIVTGERTVRLKSFADYTREEMEAFCSQMEAYLSEQEIPFECAS